MIMPFRSLKAVLVPVRVVNLKGSFSRSCIALSQYIRLFCKLTLSLNDKGGKGEREREPGAIITSRNNIPSQFCIARVS